MAPKPKKESETIHFRPDPKTNWALWFATRVSGRKKQDIVAQGALKEADTVTVNGKTWVDAWHVEEAMRAVRFLLLMPRKRLEHEEEEKLDFIETFKPFFIDDDGSPNADRLRVLWPEIDDLISKWKTTNRLDPEIPALAMAALLRARNRKVPKQWIEYAAIRSS